MFIKEVYKEYPIDESKELIKSHYEDVEKIEYHEPMGEGDTHYCDVCYTNGRKYRIFRPDSILFFAENEVDE